MITFFCLQNSRVEQCSQNDIFSAINSGAIENVENDEKEEESINNLPFDTDLT